MACRQMGWPYRQALVGYLWALIAGVLLPATLLTLECAFRSLFLGGGGSEQPGEGAEETGRRRRQQHLMRLAWDRCVCTAGVVSWGAVPHLMEQGLSLLACTEHEDELRLLRAHPSTYCDLTQTIGAAVAVFLLGLCLPLCLLLGWRRAQLGGGLEPTASGGDPLRLERRRAAVRSMLRKQQRTEPTDEEVCIPSLPPVPSCVQYRTVPYRRAPCAHIQLQP